MAVYSADQHSASGAALAQVHSMSPSAALKSTRETLAGGPCGTWGRSERVAWDVGEERAGRA